ncbi:uncharacterized protein LOC105214228 isoform X1 [Zeugodacus cucurbitae]|uniref:uncharacterized protein LOC105214228 isoform X1 n=1 Tax=Zeugodacus cucurbitae TaxID=28588 RepID=UPI0023D92EC4|nr:uncharacterized protein LOC105214228 isoform X1 [Zeugodacus cucurbitae]
MFPHTIEINGDYREIRCLQTDPVNHEHMISVGAAIIELPDEPQDISIDDPEDSFFNSAREYPDDFIGGTLDPLSGSYKYNKEEDSEHPLDCISIDSAFTEDSKAPEDKRTKKRSFNKRILLTVERIDAKVNEFRMELGNQLKSLLDENSRRRGWQNRVNMVLSMLATEMAN